MKKQIIGSILIFGVVIAFISNPADPDADKYFVLGKTTGYLIILIIGIWLIIKGKKEKKN